LVRVGELEDDNISMPVVGSLFPRGWFVSRGIVYFQILCGSSHCLERFWGEISDFSRRMGWSAVFSSCRVAALPACETSRLGPPSRIADPGLFWAIFRMDFFSNSSSVS